MSIKPILLLFVLSVAGSSLFAQAAVLQSDASQIFDAAVPTGARRRLPKQETAFEKFRHFFETAQDTVTLKDVTGWYAGRYVDFVEPTRIMGGILTGEVMEMPDCGPICEKAFKIWTGRYTGDQADWFDRLDADKIRAIRLARAKTIGRYSKPEFQPPEARFASVSDRSGADFYLHTLRKNGRYVVSRTFGFADGRIVFESYSYYFKNVTPRTP